MTSSPDSLIMGVAARYNAEQILPFLKSLRQTSYRGRVCLLVGQMKDETIAQIRMYADDVVVLDGEYGQRLANAPRKEAANLLAWVRRTPRVRRLYASLFRATLHLAPLSRRKQLQNDLEQRLEGYQSLRYEQYLKYIDTCAPDADYILLSDVRDVIFQGDPFEHNSAAVSANLEAFDLQVFLEAPRLHIGTEPFNQRWISNLYGRNMLDSLGAKIISCSGTVMGTRSGILRYLDLMNAEIMRHQRPLGSHDQGVHNYLLYNGCLDPVKVYANGYGPVLTMGGETEIMRDAQGRLLNKDGSVAPVVHQYDRHPALAQELWRSLEQEPLSAA